MDEDNTFIADKTRCSFYAQKAYTKPGPKEFAPLVDWLQGAAREPRQVVARPIDTGGHPVGTQAAADYVAQQKIASGDPLKAPWKNMREVEQDFQTVRERAGEVAFREGLERYGWCDFRDIRKALDSRDPAAKAEAKQKVTECYRQLDALARKEGK